MPSVSFFPKQFSDLASAESAWLPAENAYYEAMSNRDVFKSLPKNIADATAGIQKAKAALENAKATAARLKTGRPLTDAEIREWDAANIAADSAQQNLASWTAKLNSAKADYERLKGTDWDAAFRNAEAKWQQAQINLISAKSDKAKWAKTPQGVAYYKEHANDPWADKPWVTFSPRPLCPVCGSR